MITLVDIPPSRACSSSLSARAQRSIPAALMAALWLTTLASPRASCRLVRISRPCAQWAPPHAAMHALHAGMLITAIWALDVASMVVASSQRRGFAIVAVAAASSPADTGAARLRSCQVGAL